MRQAAGSRRGGVAPVAVLLVLAPVSVDVVFGATRVSTPFALVPELLTYGVGAVLIRGVAESGRRGAAGVVLLGLAFTVVSECLVVQTSVAPGGPDAVGRALGVNWPYLVWALGYVTVWAVLLPIRLTEALFPRRAGSTWLGPRARLGLNVLFILGCLLAWHQWTRVVRPRFLGLPVDDPPAVTLAAAATAAVVLVALALVRPVRLRWRPASASRVPRPWLIGVLATLVALLWFGLTLGVPRALPPAIGIAPALVLAAAVTITLARWCQAPTWSTRHRLALIAGALCGNSAAGFVVVPGYSTPDLAGKVVIDVLALAMVGWAARSDRRIVPDRPSSNPTSRAGQHQPSSKAR